MISHIDHFVLTVQDIEATCRFYEQALGMERVIFGNGRLALKYWPTHLHLPPRPRRKSHRNLKLRLLTLPL